MPHTNVTEAVQIGGRIYPAGVHDLEDAVIQQATANGRGHLLVPVAAPVADEPEPKDTTEGKGNAATAPALTDPRMADFAMLTAAGFTFDSARAATDDELGAVKGVGPATLRAFREAAGTGATE